ncbi:Cytochrome subunit of sulfide dehydrogenase [Tepidimonas thermarum]|uniref:Cytochrome subunit of sulfide dehydrogenase n=1 Tax=Tepidimonas thermarum TaxID=335431 RepID=A0A554X103_9BURK|nr:c-type cytochrome [Tepidimonas thermarum]TSE29514.1 Cytochrome subunit of sulfide dehydrogenase [Tepidimonas thermarum]
MNKGIRYALAAGLLGATALAHAQVDQVKVWAAACANCHGTNGHAEPGMESLAGKNKDELMQKLMDFKTGRKPATIMHQLTKGYSDEQLQALAAYFAAQKK